LYVSALIIFYYLINIETQIETETGYTKNCKLQTVMQMFSWTLVKKSSILKNMKNFWADPLVKMNTSETVTSHFTGKLHKELMP
jgi:hypothetical protein